MIDGYYLACQDSVQSNSFGQTLEWNTDAAPMVKKEAEKCGCSSAGHAAPVLFWAAFAALANHFLQ